MLKNSKNIQEDFPAKYREGVFLFKHLNHNILNNIQTKPSNYRKPFVPTCENNGALSFIRTASIL